MLSHDAASLTARKAYRSREESWNVNASSTNEILWLVAGNARFVSAFCQLPINILSRVSV